VILSICSPSNANCNTYFLLNGSCASCLVGYSLSNGACIFNQSINQLAGCAAQVNGVCTACSVLFFNNSQGHCQPVDPNCAVFNYTLNVCVACNANFSFAINQGQCLPTPQVSTLVQNNPYCIQFTSGACTACYQGVSLTNGVCVLPGIIINCTSVNSSGQCTQCVYGFYVSSSNQCIAANPLCATYQQIGGACLTCINNSLFVNNGQCISVTSNCALFNFLQNVCITCVAGFLPNPNGNCVLG